MKETTYSTTIIAKGLQAFDEASHFLGELSCGGDFRKKDVVFYYLDSKHEQIARLNQKENKIELSDKVEGWIVDSINHIIKQENVR